jgi:hypothetical protein
MKPNFRNPVISSVTLVGILVCHQLGSFAQQTSGLENAQTQDKFCSVAGQVVRADTKTPLRKARVVLTSADDRAVAPYVAITDAEGQFTISGILPARYDMSVERDGYIPKAYGADESGDSSAILSLKAGQQITGLLFRLQRFGVTSGRVLDEDGDPAQGITVEAVVRSTFRGQVTASGVGRAATNDLGEYRLFSLQPGHYFLRAFPEGGDGRYIGRVMLESSILKSIGGYIPTYYPSASDISRASPIEMRAGDEISRVDVVLLRQRSYRIRGQIFNAAVDNPTGDSTVQLIPTDTESLPAVDNRSGMADPRTGEFEIVDVPAGSYNVFAAYRDGEKLFVGKTSLVVANADVDSVRIVITRGAEIHGRIIREGTIPPSITVTVEPSDRQILGASNSAETKPDGSFSISGLGDGLYEVGAFSECDTCYLKSATVNGVDLLSAGLQVSSGVAPSPIELVYSGNTATVDGTVVRDDGLPASGGTVILVPDHPGLRGLPDYRSGSTDQYGRFVLRGVPPGGYRIFAWQKFDLSSDMDPEFLKPFEEKAQALSISASERKTLQLTLLPSPPEDH